MEICIQPAKGIATGETPSDQRSCVRLRRLWHGRWTGRLPPQGGLLTIDRFDKAAFLNLQDREQTQGVEISGRDFQHVQHAVAEGLVNHCRQVGRIVSHCIRANPAGRLDPRTWIQARRLAMFSAVYSCLNNSPLRQATGIERSTLRSCSSLSVHRSSMKDRPRTPMLLDDLVRSNQIALVAMKYWSPAQRPRRAG